jgi:hypothetical protein
MKKKKITKKNRKMKKKKQKYPLKQDPKELKSLNTNISTVMPLSMKILLMLPIKMLKDPLS